MKTRSLILYLLALAGLPLTAPAQNEEATQALVTEGIAEFENLRYDEALAKLIEAEKLQPNSPFIDNLLGAIYTKKNEFATAKTYFEKALDLSPGFFPAMFNLGELLFLQKQYPQALESFSKMLSKDPSNELLQFKVILSLLLADQPDEAKRLLKSMKYPIKSPARYYSEAAVEIMAGDKGAASELVAKGQTLFPDEAKLYTETFIDLGWATN